MKEKPTTKILREARKLLARPHGWYKGWFASNTRDDCYCAIGALQKAATGNPYPSMGLKGTKQPAGLVKAQNLLADAIGAKGIAKQGAIVEFNDDPKTRKKDILAAFDKAIELSVKS